MLEVSLEEVAIESLRKEAQRLNIATDGIDKDQLIANIRRVRAENVPRQKRFRDPVALSLLALAVAIVAMIANWWEAYGTVAQFKASLAETNRQVARKTIEDWQKWVVFSIISKEFTKNEYQTGASIDQIKSNYLDEAKTVSDVPLAKEDIQDAALSRILMCLTREQLVYRTNDKTYAVQSTELLPGFGRLNRQEKAGYHILFVLATERGDYKDEKLQTEVIAKFALTPQEYRYLITQMIKDGYVVRDADGNLYCASNPPKDD